MATHTAFLLPAGAAVLLVALLLWQWRGARVLAQDLAASRRRQQDWHRLLRMTASDLRGPALSLLGHAENAPPELRATLVATCRYLLDLAESLLDQTEDPSAARVLREEEIRLAPLLDFVVAQVANGLGPGRRVWRIAPALDQAVLLADRRALHQVLLRVLTGAALATGDGDWIDISAQRTPSGWTLVVEDEGTGLASAPLGASPADTRGLGVGLALARSLMTAHGGGLAQESSARVGSRTLLNFPVTRLLHGA